MRKIHKQLANTDYWVVCHNKPVTDLKFFVQRSYFWKGVTCKKCLANQPRTNPRRTRTWIAITQN